MKLSSIVLPVMLLAAASLVTAQEPQVGDRIKVAGCLQRAQLNGSVGGTVVGTSASPNTAPQEANSGAMVDAFLLSEATPVIGGAAQSDVASSAEHASAGATGTSGRLEVTSFGLVGREAELERHQGGRLEVTGVVEPAATSNRGTGGQATASGVKRLRVESFKVLADKCPAK